VSVAEKRKKKKGGSSALLDVLEDHLKWETLPETRCLEKRQRSKSFWGRLAPESDFRPPV